MLPRRPRLALALLPALADTLIADSLFATSSECCRSASASTTFRAADFGPGGSRSVHSACARLSCRSQTLPSAFEAAQQLSLLQSSCYVLSLPYLLLRRMPSSRSRALREAERLGRFERRRLAPLPTAPVVRRAHEGFDRAFKEDE